MDDKNGNLRSITYPSGMTVSYDPSPGDTERLGIIRMQTGDVVETILAKNIAKDPGNLLKSELHPV